MNRDILNAALERKGPRVISAHDGFTHKVMTCTFPIP